MILILEIAAGSALGLVFMQLATAVILWAVRPRRNKKAMNQLKELETLVRRAAAAGKAGPAG